MQDRPQHYPSDTSDEQWAIIEPLLPSARTGGRLGETRVDSARSDATVRPLRRDRLGGLVHEYVEVA